MINLLPVDIIARIVASVNPRCLAHLFRVDQCLWKRRRDIAPLVLFLRNGRRVPPNRDAWFFSMLYSHPGPFTHPFHRGGCVPLRDDCHGTKTAIIGFCANTMQSEFVLPCISSFHRRIAHEFASALGLDHQTVQPAGMLRSQLACQRCGNADRWQVLHDDEEKKIHCRACGYDRWFDYAVADVTERRRVQQKCVLISKPLIWFVV